MKLEQSFEVAAPLERVWEAMIDVERVAPCLPGASVSGRNEDGSYNGEFKVKIGPTSAAYAGKLKMEDIDADVHRATMSAAGTDKRGQGGAKASIVSTVTPAADGETTVEVSTDYHITGRLARFGRGGMIEEISSRLLHEFASNLQAMLAGGDAEPEPEAPAGVAGSAAEAAESVTPLTPEPAVDSTVDTAVDSAVDEAAAATEPVPAGDPDGAIEGAMPVADSLTDEPTSPGPGPAPEPEAFDAGSLVGSVLLTRIRENPVPLAALVVGFLVALGVLRRRS